MKAHRPTIMGTRYMVAACQYLAPEAGFRILETGGNAIDAGVAAGIALAVVQPEYVNFAGVAPIIIYSAADNRVFTIPGLGTWPKAIERDHFKKRRSPAKSSCRRTSPPPFSTWRTKRLPCEIAGGGPALQRRAMPSIGATSPAPLSSFRRITAAYCLPTISQVIGRASRSRSRPRLA